MNKRTTKPSKQQAAKPTKNAKPVRASNASTKAATVTLTAPSHGPVKPTSVPMKGGLNLAAAGNDGRVAVIAYEDKGQVVLVDQGKAKKIRLANWTAGRERDLVSHQHFNGMAFVDMNGTPALFAAWPDDIDDGPGIGIFELDGTARTLLHFLPAPVRAKRAKSKSRTIASNLEPRHIQVSGDGRVVAMQIASSEVRVWRLDDLTEKCLQSFKVAELFGGLAIDHAGSELVTLDSSGLLFFEIATGKMRSVELAPEIGYAGRQAFTCGEHFLLATGAIVDRKGKLVVRTPLEEINAAKCVGNIVVVTGGEYYSEKLWFIDASTGKVLLERDAPGAKRLDANAKVIVHGIAKKANIEPWPASMSHG